MMDWLNDGLGPCVVNIRLTLSSNIHGFTSEQITQMKRDSMDGIVGFMGNTSMGIETLCYQTLHIEPNGDSIFSYNCTYPSVADCAYYWFNATTAPLSFGPFFFMCLAKGPYGVGQLGYHRVEVARNNAHISNRTVEARLANGDPYLDPHTVYVNDATLSNPAGYQPWGPGTHTVPPLNTLPGAENYKAPTEMINKLQESLRDFTA